MIRLEPGVEFLPHLKLIARLGRGGMGEAWVARDARRDEDVVAKILPADASEDRVALLRREARLVRKLKHPGIVPVYGFERGPHGSAVLLRHMKGGDAGRLRGATPLQVVRLGREVAAALGYLHSMGVVHRDVKPTNVLLDEAGRAHLADFGIAAVESPVDDEGLTLHGGGSRARMSPQQRDGTPASPEDDVYSLGVLLYELLAGQPPFPAGASDEEIRTVAPPPFETPHPVPDGLRPLVASMLAKDPRERPRDMSRIEAALGKIESELAGAPSAGSREEGDPPLRAAAVAPTPEMRLQPPPRVGDVVAPTPARPAGPVVSERPEPSRSRPLAPTLLLGALGLAAVFVVLVLPRWAAAPDPSSSSESARDESSGEVEADAAPGGTIVAESAPAPEASAPPAEATPPPVPGPPERATPTPRPRAPEPPREDPAAAEARRRAEAFGAAMSAAQAALEREDWPAARQGLARAAALEPGSPAVADARRRVQQGERTAALAQQREAARAFEAKEDWRRAVAEYEVALKLDRAVTFALEGRARAASRAELAAKLDFHIAHPLRLATDAVAREAELLLQQAHEVEAPGSRHSQQIASLERALDEVTASVPVVLESDGETEVVVHKVGRLGVFARKTLELRPGTYTVVGKRSGYRDVRRQLVVEPSGPPPPLVVRCEEEI